MTLPLHRGRLHWRTISPERWAREKRETGAFGFLVTVIKRGTFWYVEDETGLIPKPYLDFSKAFQGLRDYIHSNLWCCPVEFDEYPYPVFTPTADEVPIVEF